MNIRSARPFLLAVAFSLSPVAQAQTADDAESYIAEYVQGQKILTTYREGGPIYGTYVFITVQFCASGRYFTYRESRKQTVMGNEQVYTWRDQGRWEVATVQGRPGIRYASMTGERNFIPLGVQPGGGLFAGEGITIIRQGRAACN